MVINPLDPRDFAATMVLNLYRYSLDHRSSRRFNGIFVAVEAAVLCVFPM